MNVKTEARIAGRTLKVIQALCERAKTRKDLLEIEELLDDVQAGLWMVLKK